MKKITKKISKADNGRSKKEKSSSDSMIIREIDKLARITANGFDEVNRKFGDVYKRFDEVDKRFDEVDKRFDEVDKRLGRIEAVLFWDHKNRIDRLEDQVKELQSDYRQLIGMKK